MANENQHDVVWEHRQAELWDRIFQVTQDVVTLADGLEETASGSVLRSEMVKSAMGVGRELVRAISSDDKEGFSRHVEEARMQAVETDYWLRLAYVLQQREDAQQDLSSVITQYAAIVDLLRKLGRHVQQERAGIERHTRGPRLS